MMDPEQYCHDTEGTPSKNPRTKIRKDCLRQEDGPDGTRAWCVAFAALIINFIMAGLSRMSGILYVAFIDMFETDRKTASMPFSVRSSTMNLLGPVVGILGQKYGVRIVSIFGGILGTLSAATCFFVDDIAWITILWGGVNGAGTALVCTLTTVVISQYFDKHRTTACGMSFSGACIGSFIFPPLIENLLSIYGLQGSFLIVAGIILHCLPAAMILRKPSWIKRANLQMNRDVESVKTGKFKKAPTLNVDVNDNKSGVDLNYLRSNSELVVNLLTKDLAKEKEENTSNLCPPKDEILKEMEDVYTFVGKSPISFRLSEVPPNMRLKLESETSPISSRNGVFRSYREPKRNSELFPSNNCHSLTPSPKCTQTQCKPFILSKLNDLYVKNENQIISPDDQSIYAKVLKELRILHKVYEAVKRRNIFASGKPILKTPTVVPKILIPVPEKDVASNSLWDSIKNSVSLHSNPLFLLISLCRAVHFTAFIPTVTIIVDYAMDKGLQEEDGMYIIAALSVGDLIGRLCLGWVTDSGFITLPKYMLIGMITQGICTASLPLLYTRMTILPTIVIYAMLQGSVFVRHSVLISKYMKSNEQSIAQGCVNFLAGLAGFLVPSYVGFFRDTIGSYDGIFYVNGIVGAAAGFLWIFEPCFAHPSDNTESVTQSNVQKV